jgi:ATP-binding cassette subfamily B protein
MVTFWEEPAGTSDRSGLSGPPEIPDPPSAERPRTLGQRLAGLRAAARGMVAAFPRVIALAWASGRLLTAGLASATVLAGLTPAATAYLARTLINTVAAAIKSRGSAAPGAGPAAGLVRVPLPLHLPALPPREAIGVLVAVQFVLFAANSVIGAVSQICSELLQDKVSLHIQHQIMDHASRLDLAFFEDSGSYDLLNQANTQAVTRPITMIGSAFGLAQTAITFISLAGLLAALSPLLALLAILAPVPAFLADLRYGARGFRLSMWTSPARRRMDYLSQLVTRDSYAKEVQLFGLAPYFVERFRLLGGAFYRQQRRQVVARRAAAPAWNLISLGVGAFTYAYVGLSAVAGRLTLGDLTLYTAAAVALQGAIQNLFQGVSAMYENNLYLDLLYRLLAIRPAVRAPARPAPLPAVVHGHVRFEHVWFRYPGSDISALADVSLEILPGQMMAVVGSNGAGKSTLVKLLCGLYKPSSGRILLDGTDIARLDPRDLRRHIGALFQDHVSYQATAAENIGLGDLEHLQDDLAVRQAAGKAGAGDLLSGLPRGYQTPLGKWFDQGVNLSGGEWQKIALARAFMRTVPLLVLDEPSSALDARAEHEFFVRLRWLAAGRATLYVSHRFSTIRRADQIVVLDAGRVTESGTHDELMRAGGQYAEMFLLQAEAYTDSAHDGAANETGNHKENRYAAAGTEPDRAAQPGIG